MLLKMFIKLLVILFIIKLYAQNKIFDVKQNIKEHFESKQEKTFISH